VKRSRRSVYQQARLYRRNVLAARVTTTSIRSTSRQLYQMAIDGMLDQLHDP